MEVVPNRTDAGDAAAPIPRVAAILWLVVAIAICLKLLLDIVQQSFFLDGLIYSSIARNLAEGVGTFWAPQFSKTLFPVFAEHPPLMMWLESFAFRLFGDTVIIDKLFSLATFAASLAIIAMTWLRLNGADAELRRGTPVVMVLTIIAGRFAWGFANGLLENLLIVFTSLAVFCVVAAYDGQSTGRRLCFLVAAGLLTALALMTKGPVGLFPLAAPGIYWLSFRRPTFVVALVDTVIIGAVIVGIFAVMWSIEGPRGTIERYVSAQILTSLSGERGHNGSGIAALRTFIRVNAYPLLLTAVVLFIGRRAPRPLQDGPLRRDRTNRIVFFSVTGFSASLPLLLAPRVSSFYFNPSLPYFAAALAIVCTPVLWRMLSGLPERLLRKTQWLLAGLLGLSLFWVVFHLGQPGQYSVTIDNAEKVASEVCSPQVPCDAIVSTCGSVHGDWLFHAYLQRNFRISLDDPAAPQHDYLLASDDCALGMTGYRETGVSVAPYRLLRRG